jgi:hypothetical protein
MFEENTDEPWANIVLSFFYHRRTANSHIPQQFYPICCGEDSGSGDVLARVHPLLISRISLVTFSWNWRRSAGAGDVQWIQWNWWRSDTFCTCWRHSAGAGDVQLELVMFSWSWWHSVQLVTFSKLVTFSWIWRRSAEAGDVQINFFLHLLYLLWSLSLRWLMAMEPRSRSR